MCGICYTRDGSRENLAHIFDYQSLRGMDSLGFICNGQIYKYIPKGTTIIEREKEYTQYILDKYKGGGLIFHHRKASIGNVSIDNTHPITIQDGYYMVHNGTIKNILIWARLEYGKKFDINKNDTYYLGKYLMYHGIDNLKKQIDNITEEIGTFMIRISGEDKVLLYSDGAREVFPYLSEVNGELYVDEIVNVHKELKYKSTKFFMQGYIYFDFSTGKVENINITMSYDKLGVNASSQMKGKTAIKTYNKFMIDVENSFKKPKTIYNNNYYNNGYYDNYNDNVIYDNRIATENNALDSSYIIYKISDEHKSIAYNRVNFITAKVYSYYLTLINHSNTIFDGLTNGYYKRIIGYNLYTDYNGKNLWYHSSGFFSKLNFDISNITREALNIYKNDNEFNGNDKDENVVQNNIPNNYSIKFSKKMKKKIQNEFATYTLSKGDLEYIYTYYIYSEILTNMLDYSKNNFININILYSFIKSRNDDFIELFTNEYYNDSKESIVFYLFDSMKDYRLELLDSESGTITYNQWNEYLLSKNTTIEALTSNFIVRDNSLYDNVISNDELIANGINPAINA